MVKTSGRAAQLASTPYRRRRQVLTHGSFTFTYCYRYLQSDGLIGTW